MTSPRTLLNTQNIRAKKTLGQHFLTDPKTAERIVLLSEIGPGDTVLEIGSGLGALTVPASGRAKRLIAVETDRRLIDLLKAEISSHGFTNVTIVEESILKLDILKIADAAGEKLVVLGNLPYNISSLILVRLVGVRKGISRAILMLQKEVVDRITALPGKKARGRLSILIQYCARVRGLLDVSSSLFFPRPKVDSRVVEIAFHEETPLEPEAERHFFQIVQAAFGKRRKTLKNALSQGGLGLNAEMAGQILDCAGIDPKRRAETIELYEFINIYNEMEAITTGRS